MQNWIKIGKVFEVSNNYEWMYSHSAVPFVEELGNDLFKVYFTTRNRNNESSIGYIIININDPKNILEVSEKPILTKGSLGTFDDSGAMGCSIISVNNQKYLYYQGWNLSKTVPYRNSIGVAISKNNLDFYKFSEGPIIDRTYKEPHFSATPNVLYDEGIYKMWYLSCTKWEKDDIGNINHFYHIKYAESSNGIDWDREGYVAIDFKDQYEYAISVPRVIKENGIYKMWFSSRATKNISTYRIKYAESIDGKQWIRKDEDVNLDVSLNGWDSEMICYPFVFNYNNYRYMFYNGNDYGKTGFGLAILDRK